MKTVLNDEKMTPLNLLRCYYKWHLIKKGSGKFFLINVKDKNLTHLMSTVTQNWKSESLSLLIIGLGQNKEWGVILSSEQTIITMKTKACNY